MLVTKEFTFDSAHQLTKYSGKCENLHGHTYKLLVTVEGEVKDDDMVIDFVILKRIVKEKIIERLDHTCLNDLFENPTAEVIAKFIWDELKDEEELTKHGRLHKVKLWENPTSYVSYLGE